MSRRIVTKDMKKQSKSIHLEKWLWDFSSSVDPCRSGMVKELFLNEIKRGLLEHGLVDQNTLITKEHGELYLKHVMKKQPYLKSVSSSEYNHYR